jgi:hypothetical protein
MSPAEAADVPNTRMKAARPMLRIISNLLDLDVSRTENETGRFDNYVTRVP